MVPELAHLEKYIRNTSAVFKCGAGEHWRRSFGLIV
jgi:hypothetical protein